MSCAAGGGPCQLSWAHSLPVNYNTERDSPQCEPVSLRRPAITSPAANQGLEAQNLPLGTPASGRESQERRLKRLKYGL